MRKIIRGWLTCFVLLTVSLFCHAHDMTSVAGKSAKDVFQNDRVVALLNAVSDGNTAKARGLLVEGVNINTSGLAGLTPLIWMMAEHDERAVHQLLELGADPNKPWDRGEAPVYMAASGGNLGLLNMLLDYRGNPDSPAHERSAMMIAMQQLHFDCAQLLVKRGADINFHDGVIRSISAPLAVGRFDWVVWMLENGYNYDLASARRGVVRRVPLASQVPWKKKALEVIDQRIGGKSSGD